jgi:hypothetical protein
VTVQQLVGSILLGADDLVGELVKSRIPQMRGKPWGPFSAIGVVRRGELVGGVVYHGYQGFDVQMSCAFDRVGWALPGTLRAIFHYPFEGMHCVRVTAAIGRKNKKARKLVEGIGFKYEGLRRKALDGREDEVIYGMLKTECRWISHGQKDASRRSTAA